VGGGVQLGPLGTAATNRSIVPAPGDYDDGEIGGMIGKGNCSTRRKPASVPLCTLQTSHAVRTRSRAAEVGWNPDNSVVIATGYELNGPGSIPGNARFFSSPQNPDRLWDPLILISNGSLRVRRQRREADHSSPSRAEGGPLPPLRHLSSRCSALSN
jgi:hypothetical protein